MQKLLLVGCLILLAAATEIGATRVHDVANDGVSADVPPVPSNYSFLQKHVAFFDRDKDGIIYIKETIEGLRAVGVSLPLALVTAPGIHFLLSPKTRPGKGFSRHFPIEIANIALARHGSDTGAYDDHGNFVESKFEEIFSKHAHTNPNALTSDELNEMVDGNKDPHDTKGHTAAKVEWRLLFDLAKDKDGLLQKETVRSMYDGSLFYTLEEQHKSKKE